MRLESALFSSREGLTANGQAIAVIGDNISNVETTGFKASRTEFGDIFAEALGSKDSGPLQSGNGVRVSRVRQIHESGEPIQTGRQLDVAIQGDGFFIVGDGEERYYTRAGNFRLDLEGNLVTADGKSVLGTLPTAEGAEEGGVTLSQINLANLATGATATTTASLTGNLSSSAAVTTPPADPATFRELNGAATAIQSLDVFDSLGNRRSVSLAFFKTAANTWTVQAYADGGAVGGTAGKPTKLGEVAGITFQGDGTLTDAAKAQAVLTAQAAWADGANAGNFTINFSGYTQNANPSELRSKVQDGRAAGSVQSYEINSEGKILAELSTGQSVEIATIALARFQNIDGLERIGSASYRQTGDSGEVVVEVPGGAGVGTIQGGALERSTSDLSKQFTDLVLYQRGYQANSNMLNTTGNIIRETLGLIR